MRLSALCSRGGPLHLQPHNGRRVAAVGFCGRGCGASAQRSRTATRLPRATSLWSISPHRSGSSSPAPFSPQQSTIGHRRRIRFMRAIPAVVCRWLMSRNGTRRTDEYRAVTDRSVGGARADFEVGVVRITADDTRRLLQWRANARARPADLSASARGAASPNTGAGERLPLASARPSSPRRYVVLGPSSFDNEVDRFVIPVQTPDHVAVRVDDGTHRRCLHGEHRDAGG